MDILKIENLSKQFGNLPVIRNLSLTIPEYGIYGFLGKNGAGKTTTMKLVLGFLKPDSGYIRVMDEPVIYGHSQTNRHIGYLPDVPEFYSYMTPIEYLKLCGKITGLSSFETNNRIKALLSLTGLESKGKRKIRGFSRGEKQRLGIAQALLNQPKLMICDEPTSALDPVGQKEVLDILTYAKEKTTILFSTHILSDVEKICDHIGIINNGSLVVNSTVAEIKSRYRTDTIKIEVKDIHALPSLALKLKQLPLIEKVIVDETKECLMIHLSSSDIPLNSFLQILSKEEVPITKYELLEPSLENIFVNIVKQKDSDFSKEAIIEKNGRENHHNETV